MRTSKWMVLCQNLRGVHGAAAKRFTGTADNKLWVSSANYFWSLDKIPNLRNGVERFLVPICDKKKKRRLPYSTLTPVSHWEWLQAWGQQREINVIACHPQPPAWLNRKGHWELKDGTPLGWGSSVHTPVPHSVALVAFQAQLVVSWNPLGAF